MKRRAHIVKANKRCERVQSVLYFDTETKEVKLGKDKVGHKLVFGYGCHATRKKGGSWTGGDWSRFTKREQFIQIVNDSVRPKVKLYLICLQTKFDIPVLDLFTEMAKDGWVPDMMIIDAPPTIVRWKKNGQTVVLLDVLNFFRASVSELGERLGLPKLDMPDSWTDQNVANAYCRRDVEIIKRTMESWWDFVFDNNLGGVAHTTAGQAFRTYRHRFMPFDIFIDNNERATRLARSGYFGGRTECFFIGEVKKPLHYLDVNGMYPSVMKGNLYPVKLINYSKRVTVPELEVLLSNLCVTARVTINTPEAFAPKILDHRNTYVTGRFTTVLSSPELQYALDHGYIEKVHEASIYECEPIFTEYVDYFQDKKVEAKLDGRDIDAVNHKLMGNGLYGKWGQTGYVWEVLETTEDLSASKYEYLDARTGKFYMRRQLGGVVQEQTDEQEARESFPAIAAHVTAYARMKLWAIFKKAGLEHVYYTDTDSVVVDDVGFSRLKDYISPSDMGLLKHEFTSTDNHIYGAKDYRFGVVTRTKGVKRKAIWVNANTVEQDQWSSLKGSVAQDMLGMPTTKKVRKTLKRVYTRGNVCPSGRVTPLEMEGDDVIPAAAGSAAAR